MNIQITHTWRQGFTESIEKIYQSLSTLCTKIKVIAHAVFTAICNACTWIARKCGLIAVGEEVQTCLEEILEDFALEEDTKDMVLNIFQEIPDVMKGEVGSFVVKIKNIYFTDYKDDRDTLNPMLEEFMGNSIKHILYLFLKKRISLVTDILEEE